MEEDKKYNFKEIDYSDLKLDLFNPRLPKSKQGKSELAVIEFMLLESATLELMMAIGENDFFAGEQLLVIQDSKEASKYIVVEGNRRLTAVKLLSNPELAKVKKESIKKIIKDSTYKPKRIPCLVFKERKEILKYLGFRHITGIKSWRLLEKARYLYDLKNTEFKNLSFQEGCRSLAKSIGSSSNYIRRLLIGFELYEKVEDEGFYSIKGLDDTRFHLNYFTDSLIKDNIRNFIGVNLHAEEPLKNLKKENLKKVVSWWFDKTEGNSRVLGDSTGLKWLNAVIGNKKALKSFEEGATIEMAREITDDYESLFKKEVQKSLFAIEQADFYSNKIKDFYSNLYDDLKSINDITRKIRNFQQQKERDSDDF